MESSIPLENLSDSKGQTQDVTYCVKEQSPPCMLQNQTCKHSWWLAGLAAILSFGLFWMDGNLNPDLADEGYLWHGMTALKEGQVPMRDFHAYDPGRYCWLAACSYIFGDGLISMRASCVLFQCIGVWCGLLALRRLTKDWKLLVLAGITLVLWMFPTYKAIEQTIGLIAIFMGVRLLENPILRNYFLTGTFIGFMAFFGRNHGVYQVAAFGLMTLLITRADWRLLCSRVLVCAGGVIIGYLPQLVMLIFIPGYFDALVASITVIFTYGTNVFIPIPMPWHAFGKTDPILKLQSFIAGSIYLGLILFIVISVLQICKVGLKAVNNHPVFLSAACMTGVYSHFSFSRADGIHLAHVVPLWIVGMIAICFTLKRARNWLPLTILITILVSSLPISVVGRGLMMETLYPSFRFAEVEVAGQIMRMRPYTAEMIELAKKLSRITKTDESLAFFPYLPGLYPVVNRLCPTRQSYFIIPMSKTEEETTIAALRRKNVKWVVLQDVAMDGREDMRFFNTNPLTYAYLKNNFEIIANYPELQNTFVLRLKE